MIVWYNNLNLIQRIYALIAIPSTAILLIQTIMMFFGFGHGDGSADVHDGSSDFDADNGDINGVHDGGDGLALFSIRGIVAMLCIGGWSGVALGDMGMSNVWTILLSTLIGFAALIGMALIVKMLLRLQSSGNIQLSNAIGKVGQVYIPIPASMKGVGKVNLTVQEQYSEFNAMTRDETTIKTGEIVRVVGTDEVGYLVVERIKPK